MEKQTAPFFALDSDLVELGLLCASSPEFADAFARALVGKLAEGSSSEPSNVYDIFPESR
jgi:hypothetical protein